MELVAPTCSQPQQQEGKVILVSQRSLGSLVAFIVVSRNRHELQRGTHREVVQEWREVIVTFEKNERSRLHRKEATLRQC
jgi:hydrogenase maturation factor